MAGQRGYLIALTLLGGALFAGLAIRIMSSPSNAPTSILIKPRGVDTTAIRPANAGPLPAGDVKLVPPMATQELVVHIAGAVKNPSVQRLPSGSRVIDAVKAAGGGTEKADLDALNLAAPLLDGTQLYVPSKASVVATGGKTMAAATSPVAERSYSAKAESAAPVKTGIGKSEGAKLTNPGDGSVNINSAGVDELLRLPGVGPVTAEAIVQHRMANGVFTSAEAIQDVKGIGPKKFEAMRPFLKIR